MKEEMAGEFLGHFDLYDNGLADNEVLSAHLINSICHLKYENRRLTYTPGNTVLDVYEANKEFFQDFVIEYQKRRRYKIEHEPIKKGIEWFLQTVNI